MSFMSNRQDWPDELDALVAAPLHHDLLFENEVVRVLGARILPGQTVPLHTHRWPCALYILAWSDFVRRDAEGAVLLDTRISGKILQGRACGPARFRRTRWKTSANPCCIHSAWS